MLKIIKYTVVANIEAEGLTLHRELDFLTEEEANQYISENPEFEKIAVWAER